MLAVVAAVLLISAAVIAFVVARVREQRKAVFEVLDFDACSLCGSDDLKRQEGGGTRCRRCTWESRRERHPAVAALVGRYRLLREAELEVSAAVATVHAAARAQDDVVLFEDSVRGRTVKHVDHLRPVRALLVAEARDHLDRARAQLRALDPSHVQLVPATWDPERSLLDVEDDLRRALDRLETLRVDLGRRIREGSYRTN